MGKQGILPYDAEVEWLENYVTHQNPNGSFLTGVVPHAANTSFEVKVAEMSGEERAYAEVRNNCDQTINGLRRGMGFTLYRSAGSNISVGSSNGVGAPYNRYGSDYWPAILKYDAETRLITCRWGIDTIDKHTSTAMTDTDMLTFNYTDQFRLYRGYVGGQNQFLGVSRQRLYWFKMWKSGQLILDLVPVRINGQVHLYNRANGKIIRNQDPHLFFYGPDVKRYPGSLVNTGNTNL